MGFKAQGITLSPSMPSEAILLKWFTTLLRAPDFVFMMAVGSKLKGRGEGYTSMAQDLKSLRVPTEIDFLNGAIVELGKAHGVPTPVNEKLIWLIKQAEAANAGMPGISAESLQQQTSVSMRTCCCL